MSALGKDNIPRLNGRIQYIHLAKDSTTTLPPPNPLGRDMASNFISSGCELFLDMPSLGKMLTFVPKFFLSTIPHLIGEKIQNGHDLHSPSDIGLARCLIGSAFNEIGDLCEAPIEIVQGAIDVSVALLRNLASFVLWALTENSFAGPNTRVDKSQPVHNDASERARITTQIVAPKEKSLITSLPILTKKAEQSPLPKEQVERAAFLFYGIICRSFPTESKVPTDDQEALHPAFRSEPQTLVSPENCPPCEASLATLNDIPVSLLARRENQPNTGKTLRLHIDTRNRKATALEGTNWSSLYVSVFKEPDGRILLGFPGTCRSGMVKTNIAAHLGILDSAFRDAEKLVAAFVEKHGADKVEVVGYSQGGALAQYAGVSNGVKVTAFNAMGLHVSQRNELGEKMVNADVTLINTERDWLSQGLEHITASSQVGHRYVIPDSHGHQDIGAGLMKYMNP